MCQITIPQSPPTKHTDQKVAEIQLHKSKEFSPPIFYQQEQLTEQLSIILKDILTFQACSAML